MPVLRALRVPDRVAYTVAGLAIVVVWLLPFRVVETLVPGAQMDFSMWVVGGLLIVLGATWTVIYNADALLGATDRASSVGSGRWPAVLRISMAYPLRNRLRTGHDARDVHARRLHARRRDHDAELVHRVVEQRRRRSAAASTCAR